MNKEHYGKKLIKTIDHGIDYVVIGILCIMLFFGIYSLWDSEQVYLSADADNYQAYYPSEENSPSFRELQEMNPDVIAWLTVNDTPIDYPVVQAGDNEKYLMTNAEGEYSMSGSIYMDYRNNRYFKDFNTIIFGHHMAQEKMFGSIDQFRDKTFFDTHRYGNLYYNEKNHGVEFFAFIEADAYDRELYEPAIKGNKYRQEYLDYISSIAKNERETDVSANDHIILLSTCSEDITNGRFVLVGRLTDELHLQEKTKTVWEGSGIDKQLHRLLGLPFWSWLLIILLLLVALIILDKYSTYRKQKKEKK